MQSIRLSRTARSRGPHLRPLVLALTRGYAERTRCARASGPIRLDVRLGLARSSFYHAAASTPTQLADLQIGALIETVFRHHRRRCGYRRIGGELVDGGVVCAPARIRRIMAQQGLRALQPKNFVPKTSDGRADQPSPNLLAGQPLPDAPNRVWAGDITFIPTSSGWLYLAIVINLYSRRIVGWSLADHLRVDLVLSALQQAHRSRTAPGAVFHSDRGSQYGSTLLRKALIDAGMLQSMSARASPDDNAWSESFIATLKSEVLRVGCFENAADARTEIFNYIRLLQHHRKRLWDTKLLSNSKAQLHSLN